MNSFILSKTKHHSIGRTYLFYWYQILSSKSRGLSYTIPMPLLVRSQNRNTTKASDLTKSPFFWATYCFFRMHQSSTGLGRSGSIDLNTAITVQRNDEMFTYHYIPRISAEIELPYFSFTYLHVTSILQVAFSRYPGKSTHVREPIVFATAVCQ